MRNTDPALDACMAKAAPFAQPILARLRHFVRYGAASTLTTG